MMILPMIAAAEFVAQGLLWQEFSQHVQPVLKFRHKRDCQSGPSCQWRKNCIPWHIQLGCDLIDRWIVYCWFAKNVANQYVCQCSFLSESVSVGSQPISTPSNEAAGIFSYSLTLPNRTIYTHLLTHNEALPHFLITRVVVVPLPSLFSVSSILGPYRIKTDSTSCPSCN